MTLEELFSYSKAKIRGSDDLANSFRDLFAQVFGREPKMCCSFSDYNVLKDYYYSQSNPTKQMLTKYRILYPREAALAYLKDGKVYRMRASNATDEFIEEFLKYLNKTRYPNANKMILPLMEVKQDKTKPEKATGEMKSEKPKKKASRTKKKQDDAK